MIYGSTFEYFSYLWHVNEKINDNKRIKIMTNKRDLKRAINYICSDLAAECVAASFSVEESERENIEALIMIILVTRNDYVKRVSHLEPGMQPKAYYKKLISDFNQQISEIIDQVTNLL